MNDQTIIERKYAEAVKGIKEEWFITADSRWYDHVIELPGDLQNTYLIVVMYNQVFNGGFQQYFVNGYGQFAKETIRALIKINALGRAELLAKALEIVNKENDPDNVFRERLLKKDIRQLFVDDDLAEPLDQLDAQCYDYEEKENITQLLSAYLRSRERRLL